MIADCSGLQHTITVYGKGAEVVRMYKTLLRSLGFKKRMDLYFKRHDGQAVTCEDFFAAMQDANVLTSIIFCYGTLKQEHLP